MVKYLIVHESYERACNFAKMYHLNKNEWKWIPDNNSFMKYATGWYIFVMKDEVKVIGMSKDQFLFRYERGR